MPGMGGEVGVGDCTLHGTGERGGESGKREGDGEGEAECGRGREGERGDGTEDGDDDDEGESGGGGVPRALGSRVGEPVEGETVGKEADVSLPPVEVEVEVEVKAEAEAEAEVKAEGEMRLCKSIVQ